MNSVKKNTISIIVFFDYMTVQFTNVKWYSFIVEILKYENMEASFIYILYKKFIYVSVEESENKFLLFSAS